MASTKELRTRIKSITNTAKVTGAMQMIAASKLRKAQDAAENYNVYSTNYENIKNSMAYVVQKYSMGYDFEKVDYITFCDPKSSYNDIIQCTGRGTRPDKLGEKGTNLEKKLSGSYGILYCVL